MSETLEQRAEALYGAIMEPCTDAQARSMVTAALRLERELAVRECAEAARAYVSKWLGWSDAVDAKSRLNEHILSVAKPAAPVWEHRKDCPSPYAMEGGTWTYKVNGVWQFPAKHASYCDGCGAPKPEVQP